MSFEKDVVLQCLELAVTSRKKLQSGLPIGNLRRHVRNMEIRDYIT